MLLTSDFRFTEMCHLRLCRVHMHIRPQCFTYVHDGYRFLSNSNQSRARQWLSFHLNSLCQHSHVHHSIQWAIVAKCEQSNLYLYIFQIYTAVESSRDKSSRVESKPCYSNMMQKRPMRFFLLFHKTSSHLNSTGIFIAFVSFPSHRNDRIESALCSSACECELNFECGPRNGLCRLIQFRGLYSKCCSIDFINIRWRDQQIQ